MASSLIERLLNARGISDTTAIKNFLNPHTAFENPFMMKDMYSAVSRIERAIKSGERITVFGDYDVDGVSATAIMYRTLSDLGAAVDTYIPKRSEGYGLNSNALKSLAEKGTNLLITVDTGIGNEKEISEIADKFDVIVTDHHLVPEGGVPSAVAVLNPHQAKDYYPNKNLSGAGVAFKLSQALRNKITGADIQKSVENLELAALATVADVVPMTGENRKIVADGLKAIQASQDKAIQALLKTTDLAQKKHLTAEDIGFKIAPRINAAGRVEDPGIALSLFTLDQQENKAVFQKIADSLSELNKKRKAIEADIVQSAEKQLLQLRQQTGGYISSVIVENKGWHEGVVGLAAARLSERHKLPSIVLTSEDGKIYHGSARSVPGFNVMDALRETDKFLLRYGGHEQAAGLVIKAENLSAFKAAFDNFARDNFPSLAALELVDADLDPAEITLADAKELEKMGPFGVNNERPIFGVSDVRASDVRTSSDGKHLFFNIGDKRAVAFGAGNLEDLVRDSNVDVTFSLDINEFRGTENVQLNVKSVRPVAGNSVKALPDTVIQDIYKFLQTRSNEPFNVSTLAADFSKKTGVQISGYDFGTATKILEELGLFSAVVNDGSVFTASHNGNINFTGSQTYRNLKGITLSGAPVRVIPVSDPVENVTPVTPAPSVSPSSGTPTVAASVTQDIVVSPPLVAEETAAAVITENVAAPVDLVTLPEENISAETVVKETEKAGIVVDTPDTPPVPVQEEISAAVQKDLKITRDIPEVWDSVSVNTAADVAAPVKPTLVSVDPKIADRVRNMKQKLAESKKQNSTKPKQERQKRQTDIKPTKPEKREQWFIDRINELIKYFRYPLPANDAPLDEILLSKIRDESLRAQISYPDPDLVDEKTYIQELIRLKEEQASKDLDALKKIINADTDLGKKLVDIRLNEIGSAAEEALRESYESGNIEAATTFYDEDLAKVRIRKKYVKGKDGQEYLRDTSAETTLNEWLRQLSDTKYPGVTKQAKELRERYIDLSGKQDYKQPGSTLHRETIVLREKIGKEIAKRAGKDIEDKVKDLASKGGSLLYRRIADRIIALDNDVLTTEQQGIINRLMFNFETDVDIFESYKQIAKTLGLKVKFKKDQSAVDKVKIYRKELSERLEEIKGRQDIDKISLGYLDLISANKDKDDEGYTAAKKQLIEARTDGLWNSRVRNFENPSQGKPTENLALWLRYADVAIADQQQRRAELLDPNISLERFNELLEDPKYRHVMPRVSYTKDGKQATRMAGTRFNNKLYRVGISGLADIDLDRLKADAAEVLAPFYDSIRESHNRIIAARGLTEKGLADQIISLKNSLAVTPPKEGDYRPKRLKGLQKLYDYVTNDPTKVIQDKIEEKDYTAGLRKAIYLEEKLKIEADIYETDPNAKILLSRDLKGDERLSALRDIRTQKQWAAADIPILSEGLSAPNFVGKQSLEKQWRWWQTAINNVRQLSSESFEDVQERLRNLESSERKNYLKSLPKDYIVEVKGAAAGDSSIFYRTIADKEILDEFEEKLNTTIKTLFEQDRQGLIEHYNKRLEDLDTRRKMLEEKDAAEKTKEDTEELEKILTTEQKLQKKQTDLSEAVDPVTRIDEKAAIQGQRISWKQQSAEILQLQRDIRDIIPSISFKDIFDEREKDTKVDKKTKYSNRVIALREIRDELKAVQQESFDDFQKRVADLGSLPAWLPKHSLIKIGKEEGQNVRYYRTFVDEDTQQLDKEIQENLNTIRETDEQIQEIFKEQANKKLEYLQKQEQQYPTPDGSQRKQAIERLTDRLEKLKDQSNAADQIEKIGGYNARYQVAQREATNLPTKLKILQADPNYHFDEDFKYDTANEVITNIQNDTKALADIKGKYEGYDNEYLSKFKPIKEQLDWWQAFDQEYQWLTTATQEQVSDKLNKFDSEEFRNYRRSLPDNFFDTFFVKQDKIWYRIGTDVSEQEADVMRKRQEERDESKRKREQIILNTGQKPVPSVTAPNVFGIANSSRMADSSVIDKVTEMSKLTGQAFSDSYDQLLVTEREVYDRNFGKPIKSNGVWYQNIFVMPNDAWKDFEEQNGRAIPRVRPGVDKQESYDVVAEQELQQKITADIRERSWNFVPKTRTALPAQQTPSSPSVTSETKETAAKTVRPKPVAVIKEQKSAIEKVLQELRSPTTMKSMGMMGLAGAFALWNMAMTGPSREAQEHRRRVEEERRMRQYGY